MKFVNYVNSSMMLCRSIQVEIGKRFTLTIDEKGEAHTEFSYEPQSCLDGFEFEFAKDFK